MLYRLRQRSSDESGFTLIELLVVILIIGILAAIAIPSLLSQKSKAYDAQAKSLASSAQTAAETIATDNNGSYEKVSEKEIHEYEKSIPIEEAKAGGGAWLEKASGTTNSYTLTVVAPNTKDKFTISRNEEGVITRSCEEVDKGDNGCKGGTW